MSLTIAFQMDHPRKLNPRSDSTRTLAEEAQKRGHRLFFFEPESVSATPHTVFAQPAFPITLTDCREDWYALGEAQTLDLGTVDSVLIRQDPPYDMAYLTATYLLERLPQSVLVANRPDTLRNAPEKLSILRFPDALPPTLISHDLEAIHAFWAEHRDIIVKPLYSYGGRSVFRFRESDNNLDALLEQSFSASREPLMIQRFLPEVAEQDRRVILIDGKVICAFGRIPAAGEVRANLRVGGTPAPAELNAKQLAICARVGAFLKETGVLFAGVDLIGDYLTEINITSPTGLRAAIDLYGINPAVHFWDALEAALSSR